MRERNPLSNFWLHWAIANTLAGAITGALEAGGFQFAATLLFTGVLVGAAQWVVLRRYRHRVKWWAIATAVGWIAGQYLEIAIRDALPFLYAQPFYSFIPTLVVAIAQELALPIQPWLRWLGISALGGIINSLLATGVCAGICQPMLSVAPGALTAILATAISYGAGWLGYGLATGIPLQKFVGNVN